MYDAMERFGEPQDVVLKSYDKKITVRAYFGGPWAIHKTLVDVSDVSDKRVVEMEGMWDLTHWRTGWTVVWDQWKENLALLAELLSRLDGWESDDFSTLPIREAHTIIEAWKAGEVDDV
jgi:hypothetical protein